MWSPTILRKAEVFKYWFINLYWTQRKHYAFTVSWDCWQWGRLGPWIHAVQAKFWPYHLVSKQKPKLIRTGDACRCSPPASRFNMLRDAFCSQQCNERLSEWALPFCQLEPAWPLSPDFSHQQGISVSSITAHRCFFCFWHRSEKQLNSLLWGKIPRFQHFQNYSNEPVWHH